MTRNATRLAPRLGRILSVVALVFVPAATALAQDGQGIVLRTLDEPVTISVPEMPINLVLTRLAGRTGLSIRIDDQALELLPYGEETRLRVNARESLPGEILTAMLRPMCLTWSVEGREIVIRPGALLKRMGRRPTYRETLALAAMTGGDIQPDKPVEQQMRELTGLETLHVQWPPLDELARSRALKAAERRLPCTAAEYLDALCEHRGLTWLLSGDAIVILTETEQIQRLLGRVISANYRKRPLADIILDLAHQGGLTVTMDPGVLAKVDPAVRNAFTLILSRATIREAFEAVTGATGLIFEPDGAALVVKAADAAGAASTERPADRPDFLLVATVTGEAGETYQMLIRTDELPADILEQLARQKDQLLRRLTGGYDSVTETETTGKDSIKDN